MERIFDRIVAADGTIARMAGWAVAQVLPAVDAQAATCVWRCTNNTRCESPGLAYACLTSVDGSSCPQICRCVRYCV